MPTQIYTGSRHLLGLAKLTAGTPSTVAIDMKSQSDGLTTISGYISPNMQSGRLTNNADVIDIRNSAGVLASIIANDEFLECSFDFVPEGSNYANALLSGTLPPIPTFVAITGMMVIPCGPWSDAFNVTSGGLLACPWIYRGGGTVNGTAAGQVTLSMTLRRHQGFTAGSGTIL